MKFRFVVLFALIFLPTLASSQPVLFDPAPQNASYIPVGSKEFTINITDDDLNASSVFLHMRAEDIANWETFQMACENYTLVDWICRTTVPLGIVGSDTLEYYYFEAKDLAGNVGYNGTQTDPLWLIVDGLPPSIKFVFPTVSSWVSGTVKLQVEVSDTASGVNTSSVFYALLNQSWERMQNNTYFWAEFNSTQFQNNQTVDIAVRASDLVDNTGSATIWVKVDNEKPKLTVVKPEAGKTYSGIILLEISVSDDYSGIDYSKVSFSTDGISRTMDCNSTCTEYLDTTLLADGEHVVKFEVHDNAGNANITNITIITQNVYPAVKFEHPEDGTFTSENIFINVSAVNPSEIIQYAQIRLKTAGYIGDWMNMTKEANYSYHYFLDISGLQDGEYEVTVKFVNTLNYPINSTIALTIDREKPEIDVTYPDFYVRGDFNSQIIVLDAHELNLTVLFEIENYTQAMNCVEYLGGKKLVCSLTFNSSLLSDGKHKITFRASDLAGNEIAAEKAISVDNNPPVLQYFKIEPLFSSHPTTFKFLAYLEDEGSSVENVSLFIRYPNATVEELRLQNVSSWKVEKFIPLLGIYHVDLNASDLNRNSIYLEKAGYFYVGSLVCGDGICQEEENYCICTLDCEVPTCEANEVVDCGSGKPTCIPIEMKEENYCGDGICFGDENCSNCEVDCGKCLIEEEKVEEKYVAPILKMLEKAKNLYWMIPVFLAPISVLVFVLVRRVLLRKKVSESVEIKEVEEVGKCRELVDKALLSTTQKELRESVRGAISCVEKLRGKVDDSKLDEMVEILSSALQLETSEARKKLIEANIMLEGFEKIIR